MMTYSSLCIDHCGKGQRLNLEENPKLSHTVLGPKLAITYLKQDYDKTPVLWGHS